MSELFARLQQDLNSARKSQNRAAVLVLGTILSEIKNRQIDLRRELTDADITEVLVKGIKTRRESLEMYEKGERPELADQQRVEISQLEVYLPAQMSEEEVRQAVRAAIEGGAQNMGALMGKLNAELKGKAEGGTISRIAKEELASRG